LCFTGGLIAAQNPKGVYIMFKKIAIASVVVVAGLVILAKTNLGSYAHTAWKKVKAETKNQVPLEFEIERVRDEVSKLVPDMDKNFNAIAQEMVAIDNLRADVNKTRANLEVQKKNILMMSEDLKGKGDTDLISYDGANYKASRVRTKLAKDWDAYRQGEESLDSKKKLLEAKEEALSAAREQLNSMKAKKEQLEVQLAQLEAELKTLRVAEARGSFKIDDSRLARIESSLADIRNRVKVASTEAALKGEYQSDVIPVEQKVQTNDILKEIDSHFSKADGREVAADGRTK
jgi:chromosome segregation ATPase